ncbi:hypothetical protein C8R45DRAFT_1100634 [Mycena sanguinolenta]|nr:hypothetical protein C8R45DRAFT_1100634 [Mycena sanguinolenta]
MSKHCFKSFMQKIVLILSRMLPTGSLNVLAPPSRQLHEIVQPELESQQLPLSAADEHSKPQIVQTTFPTTFDSHITQKLDCRASSGRGYECGGGVDDERYQPLHLTFIWLAPLRGELELHAPGMDNRSLTTSVANGEPREIVAIARECAGKRRTQFRMNQHAYGQQPATTAQRSRRHPCHSEAD